MCSVIHIKPEKKKTPVDGMSDDEEAVSPTGRKEYHIIAPRNGDTLGYRTFCTSTTRSTGAGVRLGELRA